MPKGNVTEICRIPEGMEVLAGSTTLHRCSQYKNWGPSTGTALGRFRNKARGATPHNAAAQLSATTANLDLVLKSS